MSAIKDRVEKIINDNEIAVFAKSYCPHCKATLKTLDEIKAKYKAVDMDLDSEGEAMQNYLKDKTNQSTVPNIFIAQKHIGGNSDIDKLQKNNELKNLVKNAL